MRDLNGFKLMHLSGTVDAMTDDELKSKLAALTDAELESPNAEAIRTELQRRVLIRIENGDLTK